MKIESLSRLACPSAECAGELYVDEAEPSEVLGDGSELIEGILRCRSCGADYPVLLGVALLVPDLQQYLWGFWPEIERWGRQLQDVQISRTMLGYLGIASAHIGHAGPPPQPEENLGWSVSPYLQVHGDRESMMLGLPEGWWRSLVGRYGTEGPDPYRYLLDAAGRHRTDGGGLLAVEVGAGIGWGAAELARDYGYCLGFDWSFTAVLTARRYFLSSPLPLEGYELETEKGSFTDRPLQRPAQRDNLDFVVADGARLPVAGAHAQCLAAINVLCAAADPMSLFEEFSRGLGPEGLLLLATPYWADPGADGDSEFARGGPAFTRSALRKEFRVLEEADMVPWLLRLAQRRWNVYLSHCLVAVRT
ncbi:MAG: methyltransferase domain-containing protein [Actinomycetota bacterium]